MFNLKTKFIAHRGYSSKLTENTIDAFILAGQSEFYGVECDVHVTKDKKFIVFHDDTTARLSNVNLDIRNSTLKDIRKISLYDKNTGLVNSEIKIPLLTQYLDVCIKYNKYCIIELKNKYNSDDLNRFLDLINTYNYQKIVIISFILDNLIAIRKLNQKIPMQYLTGKYDDSLIDVCLQYKLDVDIIYSEINKERVKKFHDNGIKVNVWTVNNLINIKKIINDGVDFITTDGV